MGCGKRSEQWVNIGYHGKMSPINCGSTSVHGTEHLCDECIEKESEQYPQGWHETPGDICPHGNYVGNAGGPDHICGQCEAGE